MMYSILIYSTEGVYDRLPVEEQQKVLQRHRDLQAELSSQGRLGPTARLMGTQTAVTLRPVGDEILVTDGPFAETKEQFLGIYLIECASLDEAIEAARKLPQHVAVYEIRPVGWLGGSMPKTS